MDPVVGVNLADQAVALAQQGFRVFPCHTPHPKTTCSCAKAACNSPGKHPRTQRGHLEATSDLDKVKRLFRRPANIGIATGKGILVVDVDLKRNGDSHQLDWPDTYTVLTGNGYHYYYMVTGAYPCRVDLWDGIDIRCDGGYVIGPGSIHPNGKEYIVDPDCLDEMALAPAFLIEKMEKVQEAKKRYVRTPDFLTHGARNDQLTALAGAMRGKGMGQDGILLVLKAENEKRCRPPLEDAELEKISLSISKYAPDENFSSWESMLKRGNNGQVKATNSNCAILLTFLPEFAGSLAYNEFADQVVWVREPPPGFMAPSRGDELDEAGCLFIQNYLSKKAGPDFAPKVVYESATQVAIKNKFNPVTEHLESLVWDGTSRISGWLHRYVGAHDSPVNRVFGAKWLISAVARAFRPGCQVDHVLVLEGPQGARKSTVLRTLGYHFDETKSWHLSSIPRLDAQYATMGIQGYWILELAELDSLKNVQLSKVKQFITETVDVYKRPYDRQFTRRKRRCVFAGTTNEYDYLDSEQRRFWPVRCGTIDLDSLREDVDQLWAEATHAYQAGEDWWLTKAESLTLASQAVVKRIAPDPWDDAVMAFLANNSEVSTSEVLLAVGIELSKQDQRQAQRVATIMKKFGWADCGRRMVKGHRSRVWEPTTRWAQILKGID